MSDQPPDASRESRAQVRTMLLIGAVASALGIALALLIDWFPVPASEQAGPIDTLWDVLLIASVPVFVLVETIVLYCAIKFRMRPGEELKDGPPIHGNTKLEIIWTAIPAILLVGLCTYAYVVLTDIEKAEANSMNVRVVGEQFTWTFYYPGEGGEEISSPQLWLPAEHAGQLHGPVQGRDPRLLGPGVPHEDRRGAGDRHAHSRDDDEPHGRVPGGVRRAVRPGALDDAPERARGDARGVRGQAEPSSPRARRAAAVAAVAAAARPTARRCSRTPPSRRPASSCHTLADAGATGTTGPNLDDVVPDLSEEELRQAIVGPGRRGRRGLPTGADAALR